MLKPQASTQVGNAEPAPAPGFLSIGEAHQELMRRGAEEDTEANRDDDSSEHSEEELENLVDDIEEEYELDDEDEGPEELDFEDDDDQDEFLEEFDDEPEDQPETYTVKINGKEERVSLDELRNGYQRDADYRHKTANISEREKQLSAALEEATRNRDRYSEQLKIVGEANQSIIDSSKDIDWAALEVEDPVEFLKKKEQLRDAKDKMAETQAELRKIEAEQAKENEKHIAEYRSLQKNLILGDDKDPNNPGIIPEWRDNKVAKKESAEMERFMAKSGLTKEEVANVWDARVVGIIRKAMLYDKGKKVAGKKMRKAPPMNKSSRGKPASQTPSRRVKVLDKELDRTGDIRTATDLLIERTKNAQNKARRRRA